MIRAFLVLAVVAPLSACAPLGGSCVSSFGPAGITLTFTAAAAGTYAWTVASDDATVHCEADLPDGEPSCDGDAFDTPVVDTADDGTFSVQTTLLTAPSDTVHVTIALDDTALADEDATPDWETPDPENCPDTTFASVSYDLSAM